jgi:hypothetical protein
MRLATIADIPAVAELLNDPLIRPTIGGEGELDPSELIEEPLNRIYFDDRGGGVFIWRGPGIYEGHSFFRVRGRDAIRAGNEALSLIADARMVWGLTPESNRAARWFNRQLGFRSTGMFDTRTLGRCELFVLER